MNNIAGFIQPSVFPQPSMMSIMPQPMPMPMPMPMITSGGRSDIFTIVVISAVVVIVLFIMYRNMSQGNLNSEEEPEEFKREKFDDIDPLTRCGWEVIVSPTCPWCIKQGEVLKKHFPTFKNISTDKPAEAVPMWVNKNGTRVPGFQTYDKLLTMSNCEENL